jgi:glutamate/tyrosine decarboxylase-like PLP-dependent enzyme
LNFEAGSIPSPLNIGIENSRRFRALPVYANLLALGRQGFVDMLKRQIELARTIAEYINKSDAYELLPPHPHQDIAEYRTIYIIVLFRLKDFKSDLNTTLVRRINSSGTIYVSGTVWESHPACRFAISNWKSSVEQDWKTIKTVLDLVAGGFD